MKTILLMAGIVSSGIFSPGIYADSEFDGLEQYGVYSMNTFEQTKQGAVEVNKRQARGVIQARKEATLAAGISATITKMSILAGESFKKGDLLVQFDCVKPMADVRAASASMAIQEQKVIANKEMASFESISDYEVLVSEAELNKAIAEKESLESYVAGCHINAPYSGTVVETFVNQFEFVPSNEPLISIVDTSQPEVSIIVPSHWLRWLKLNSLFTFTVDEVGAQLEGRISRILPVVDPVSRTVRVIGTFSVKESQETGILPGMSGNAVFHDQE